MEDGHRGDHRDREVAGVLAGAEQRRREWGRFVDPVQDFWRPLRLAELLAGPERRGNRQSAGLDDGQDPVQFAVTERVSAINRAGSIRETQAEKVAPLPTLIA